MWNHEKTRIKSRNDLSPNGKVGHFAQRRCVSQLIRPQISPANMTARHPTCRTFNYAEKSLDAENRDVFSYLSGEDKALLWCSASAVWWRSGIAVSCHLTATSLDSRSGSFLWGVCMFSPGLPLAVQKHACKVKRECKLCLWHAMIAARGSNRPSDTLSSGRSSYWKWMGELF